MRLIVAAILPPVFMWTFVHVLLWAIDDHELRQSRGGQMEPWLFTAPIITGEVIRG